MTPNAPDQPLPGLEPAERTGSSPMEKAARRTIAALHAAGRVTEADALTCQTILELAAVVATGTRNGRASAVAMAAAQILAALDRLDPMETDTDDRPSDAWDELAEELRSAAAIRDPA